MWMENKLKLRLGNFLILFITTHKVTVETYGRNTTLELICIGKCCSLYTIATMDEKCENCS